MPTSVSQLTQIISRATVVPHPRVKQVARRLLETDMLPRSSGAQVAFASNVDVIVLLLGALAQCEVYAVPSIARQLFDLRDPATGQTLGSRLAELLMTIRVLDEWTETALDGEFVIDAFTPRAVVRLNISGEAVESVFAAPGVDAITEDELRRLVIVPTLVLGKIALALDRDATRAAALPSPGHSPPHEILGSPWRL